MTRFEIVVSGPSDNPDETVRGLRAMLKRIGRNFHLKCETIRPIEKPVDETGLSDSAEKPNQMELQK